MTPLQLQRAIAALGWPKVELARRLEASDQTIWRWASGITPIPDKVAAWLTARVQHEREAPPAPTKWAVAYRQAAGRASKRSL